MSSDLIDSNEGGTLVKAATASTSGAIFIINGDGSEKVMLSGHKLEAWTVTFDPQMNYLLHSDGDDPLWKGWDAITCGLAFSCPWHTAGICSTSVHPTGENLIATGNLAACMYDSFYVFNFDANAGPTSKFDPGTLSYGCDWLNGETALTCWGPVCYSG